MLPAGLQLEWSNGSIVDAADGRVLRGYGVFFRAADGRALAWDGRALRELGLHAFRAAGVSHRPGMLEHDCFALGRRVRLRPEPENPHDPNAIALVCGAGEHQLGYVPRAATAELRDIEEAIVFHEWRFSDGSRASLRLLAGPAELLDAVETFLSRRRRR